MRGRKEKGKKEGERKRWIVKVISCYGTRRNEEIGDESFFSCTYISGHWSISHMAFRLWCDFEKACKTLF